MEQTEYQSTNAFLKSENPGFVILHQERTQGNDRSDKHDTITSNLAKQFRDSLNQLSSHLGKPAKEATEWDLGIPTFASGNGFALWNGDQNFVSLFVSWDNPEDPAFLILARAPLSMFDTTPGALDPWDGKWMEKGEW